MVVDEVVNVLMRDKFRAILDPLGISIDINLTLNLLLLLQLDGNQIIYHGYQGKITRSEGERNNQNVMGSKICNFCKRNGDQVQFYTSHNLRENGKVTCPILRKHVCELCGATGASGKFYFKVSFEYTSRGWLMIISLFFKLTLAAIAKLLKLVGKYSVEVTTIQVSITW